MSRRWAGPTFAAAAWLVASCGAAPAAEGAGPVAVAVSPSSTPTAPPVFVPNADAYFPRITRFDFPNAPPAFINALARSAGTTDGRRFFVSYAGRSVMHDGVQLAAVIADFVVSPELYARSDTFGKLADGHLQNLPGSIGRPLTLGTLATPAMEITLAEPAGYVVLYQQGFFFVQVIGSDPKLLAQIAEVLIEANARRQP